ncbi:MAG: hypothetical protein WAV27_21150 [Xanthobacteraceae bacterium]
MDIPNQKREFKLDHQQIHNSRFMFSASARLFCFQVAQDHPAPCAQAVPRFFDLADKSRIVFQPIIEPIILGLESHQHACWLAGA